jgi:GNAT superfamily N-acetyltransferase
MSVVIDKNLLIRNFEMADLPGLTHLTNDLGYPTTLEQMGNRMENLLKLDSYWTLVAVSNHKIIGFIGFNKNYFWEQDGFYIKIQALVVGKEYRRFGLGKELMDSVEKFSRQIKAKSMILTSAKREERESAHQFYPKMGFESTSIAYIKKLE